MANKVKVPVIMQMEAVECGAASLCMVLAHYKKWMPLPEVRTEMGVSRDGVSALHILKTARKYGLEAKGYRYQAEKLEEKVTLPCILFWRGEHFVVLTGFSKKGFHINDPATGPRLVPTEQFKNDYSGIVLTFTPIQNEAKENTIIPPTTVTICRGILITKILTIILQTSVLQCLKARKKPTCLFFTPCIHYTFIISA